MNFLGNDSLQLLCLKCISLNFERFFTLFNSNFKESLLSCITVLQKCYCDQLLRMLSESGALKNEHLQFLINKYAREIDLQYLQNCSFSAIDARLEAVGNVIKKFSMTTSLNFPSCDDFLHRFQSIHVLQLSRSNSTNSTLQIIADVCFQLKSLDVSGCGEITDVGLSYLAGRSPPLQSLNVDCTSVTHKSVALILKNIPTLTKLKFFKVYKAIREVVGRKEFSEATSDQRFNLNNLVVISEPQRCLTTILGGCVKACPFLQELSVAKVLNQKQLELCSQFKDLTSVYLNATAFPRLSVNDFLVVRGGNLTSLNLGSFSLSIQVLSQCCPNLENLILRIPFFEEMTQCDIHFPCLKSLSLTHVGAGKPAARIITASPHLTELRVTSCNFSKEMQSALLRVSKQLKSLSFTQSPVTSVFLQQVLEECPDLSSLTVRYSGISKNDFEYITAMANERKNKVQVTWESDLTGIEMERHRIKIRRA